MRAVKIIWNICFAIIFLFVLRQKWAALLLIECDLHRKIVTQDIYPMYHKLACSSSPSKYTSSVPYIKLLFSCKDFVFYFRFCFFTKLILLWENTHHGVSYLKSFFFLLNVNLSCLFLACLWTVKWIHQRAMTRFCKEKIYCGNVKIWIATGIKRETKLLKRLHLLNVFSFATS